MIGGKGSTVQNIRKMQQNRQERRAKMQQAKKQKQQRKKINQQRGKNVDIDFQLLIQKSKYGIKLISQHIMATTLKLTVCVRKRPLFKKQEQAGQIDAVSCANPQIKIHQPKFKVDGITKYIQNHQFAFDNTFNQQQQNSDIYKYTLKPLVPGLMRQDSIVTCFAYGQTGSGKTFTMRGITQDIINDLFAILGQDCYLSVSSFQIYGGRCYDLLNQKALLTILEDKYGAIQINGLTYLDANSHKQLYTIFQTANANRTTHATVANDVSSRSHCISTIIVHNGRTNINLGKLILVDLAGSQRAQDTQSNNRQRRIQGGQINKSLLALKQCIRAMDQGATHVPFRASKLTLVLRDSFQSKSDKSKIVMIACISPGSSSADHSLNTLRYADRLKDKTNVKMVQVTQQNTDKYQIQRIMKQKKQQKKQQKRQQKRQQKKQQKKQVKIIPQPKKQNKKQQPQKISKKQTVTTVQSKNTASKQKPTRIVSKTTSKQKPDIKVQFQSDQQKQKQMKKQKHRAQQDFSVMRQTLKGNDKNKQFIDFHQKVSKILQQQQQIFVVHMAAMKQDARLHTQQSQLISQVQGIGYMDYDIDNYASKLQTIIKKKLKMYNVLARKLQKLKSNLKQQEQISSKVKQTFYF